MVDKRQSTTSDYTQIKVKKEYRQKLADLAAGQNRSMANMVEVLIDQNIKQNPDGTISPIDPSKPSRYTTGTDMINTSPDTNSRQAKSSEGSRLTSKGESET